MKLTVKERFYDKKESIYVEKETVIEREDERAQELIKAGVAVPFEEDEDKKSEDEKTEGKKPEDEKTEDEKKEDKKSEDENKEDEKPAKGKQKSKKEE